MPSISPAGPDLPEHALLELVRARVFGIIAGYPDQDDHDNRLDYGAAQGSLPGGKERIQNLARVGPKHEWH
jgi:hypothetical protein